MAWRSGAARAVLMLVGLAGGAGGADAAGDKTRGAYLVRIMDCGGCHTPGALVGAPKENEALGGGESRG